MHPLAPALIGHADHAHHADRGQLGDGVFHLGRVDVFAAADDHVLDAVHHVDEAVGVHAAAVAGVHPAVLHSRGGLPGLVPVAGHHQRAAHGDLAHRAVGHSLAVGIDDLHLGDRHRPAHRAQALPRLAGRVAPGRQRGDHGRAFGHAVELAEARGRQRGLGLGQQRLVDRRRAVQHQLQAAGVELGQARVLDQALQHRGHQEGFGAALGGDGLQHRQFIEARQDDLAAQPLHQLQRQAHAADVEHRRAVDAHAVHRPGGRLVGAQHVGVQVGLRQHHALGPAGGAAGVHHRGQVAAVAVGIGHRRGRGGQRRAVQRAGRCRAVAPVQQRGQAAAQGLQAGGGGVEVLVDQQQPGVAIVQRVGDLLRAPADVDRVDHPAGPPHRVEIHQVVVAVEAQHAHPVTRLQAECAQHRGQARHPVGQAGPGGAAAATQQRFGLGAFDQRLVQWLGQVHARPSQPGPAATACRCAGGPESSSKGWTVCAMAGSSAAHSRGRAWGPQSSVSTMLAVRSLAPACRGADQPRSGGLSTASSKPAWASTWPLMRTSTACAPGW